MGRLTFCTMLVWAVAMAGLSCAPARSSTNSSVPVAIDAPPASSVVAADTPTLLQVLDPVYASEVGQLRTSAITAPTAAKALSGLRTSRPHLLMTDSSLAILKQNLATGSDRELNNTLTRFKTATDALLRETSPAYSKNGSAMLGTARAAVKRIPALAMAYLLTNNGSYSVRAINDMMLIANFPDWAPGNFLATAEMTNAMGIGYDWLYPQLTSVQRSAIRSAIVTKGLNEGLKCYKGDGSDDSWVKLVNNYNVVCNGGLVVGALAVGDTDRVLAGTIVSDAVTSVQGGLAEFGPDGAWSEGPGYGSYALSYAVYMLASLKSSLNTAYGLDGIPGLAGAGDYRMHNVSPLRLVFNFGDNNEGAGQYPQLYWLAKNYGREDLAVYRRNEHGSSPLDLVWYSPDGTTEDLAKNSTRKLFRDTGVAFLRSSWTDPNATWIGVKGGDNGVSHGHLDLGTFVMDAMGQRWAIDLGPDDYNLSGYFDADGKRFNYLRTSTPGHNTVQVDADNQNKNAKAGITMTGGVVSVGLTAGYSPSKATRVSRTVQLSGPQVVIQDDVALGEAQAIGWQMLTRASVVINSGGQSATLSQGGKTLTVQLRGPSGAVLRANSVNAPSPQFSTSGVRKLYGVLPAKTKQARISVVLIPN